MSSWRKKIFVGFWFLLITVGQAYPYAVVYAHTQTEQCGCNLKGHKCIHGCALKKHSHHGSMDHGSMDLAAQDSSQHDQWVSPNCSQQKMQKILSFQSEPFLLSPVQSIQAPSGVDFLLNPRVVPQGLLLSCDDPPPKGETPPKDPA